MFGLLLSLMFPVHCFCCRQKLSHQEIPYLCQTDFQGLPDWNPPACGRCALPLKKNQTCPDCSGSEWSFKNVIPLYLYQEPVSDILTSYKYNNKPFLIRMLASLIQKKGVYLSNQLFSADLIVPVPLDPVKQKERGFNQSEKIALLLAKTVQKKMLAKALKRKSSKNELTAQARLNREERKKSLKNLFLTGPHARQVQGKKVVLVDDILTTGSTANECSRLLLNAGAKEVSVFVLARTPVRNSAF